MADHKKFEANHGKPFNAESITVMHGDNAFIIDFKQTTPRVDQVDGDVQQTFITDHNAVVLRPKMMKVMLNILKRNIAEYEEKFGDLPEPEETPESSSEDETDHGYIG